MRLMSQKKPLTGYGAFCVADCRDHIQIVTNLIEFKGMLADQLDEIDQLTSVTRWDKTYWLRAKCTMEDPDVKALLAAYENCK